MINAPILLTIFQKYSTMNVMDPLSVLFFILWVILPFLIIPVHLYLLKLPLNRSLRIYLGILLTWKIVSAIFFIIIEKIAHHPTVIELLIFSALLGIYEATLLLSLFIKAVLRRQWKYTLSLFLVSAIPIWVDLAMIFLFLVRISGGFPILLPG